MDADIKIEKTLTGDDLHPRQRHLEPGLPLLGSAKFFARIGKAFAETLVNLKETGGRLTDPPAMLHNMIIIRFPAWWPQPPMRVRAERGYGQKKTGKDWARLSPVKSRRTPAPSTETPTNRHLTAAKLFTERMHEVGNVCDLVTHPGEGHGHINNDTPLFDGAMVETAAFLTEHSHRLRGTVSGAILDPNISTISTYQPLVASEKPPTFQRRSLPLRDRPAKAIAPTLPDTAGARTLLFLGDIGNRLDIADAEAGIASLQRVRPGGKGSLKPGSAISPC